MRTPEIGVQRRAGASMTEEGGPDERSRAARAHERLKVAWLVRFASCDGTDWADIGCVVSWRRERERGGGDGSFERRGTASSVGLGSSGKCSGPEEPWSDGRGVGVVRRREPTWDKCSRSPKRMSRARSAACRSWQRERHSASLEHSASMEVARGGKKSVTRVCAGIPSF